MPSPPELIAPGGARVRLPAHCVTVDADDLRVGLVLAAESDDGIKIDAANVASIGQATIQLLLAAQAEAAACGCRFAIIDPSLAFVDRIAACGLAERFGLELQGVPQ